MHTNIRKGEIRVVDIKNKKMLLNNAVSSRDRRARKLALMGLEAALDAADPKEVLKSRVVRNENVLRIDGHSFDLKKFKKVLVVGGGKASVSMGEVLEEILGDHITDGVLIIPYNDSKYNFDRIRLHEASHPVPDEAGVRGVKQILDMISQVGENELIICLISGGGSSLMPLPRGNISLQEKIMVTRALLNSGATINEINTVRKHLSDFKGGWFAKKAYPSTIINLIFSDVLGDPLDVIASGPSVPDSTTFQDAIEVLERHKLWDETPESIKNVLFDGKNGVIAETPKKDDGAFKKVHNFVVGNNRLASFAVYNKLQSSGLNTLLLTSCVEGEARHIGTMFATIAREIEETGKPVPKPAAIVVGGETTVTVRGKGVGGRNQEIALGAALKIQGLDGVVVGSLSTDGIDGPTDAAGALADGRTILRSKKLELNATKALINNDSYTFFSKLGDLIFTGSTGTNVNDVSIIIAI